MNLKKIHYVLILALLVRVIFYFFQEHLLWWDTSVYVSMGRYIFSFGKLGIWEPLRPPMIPLLFGIGSWLGANVLLMWAYLVQLGFTIGLIYAIYLLGSALYNRTVGLGAALIASFTPFFFYFSYIPLSDIPSAFFAVSAFYFFIRKKDISAGVFAGLAILTRFPQAIVLVAILLLCLNVKRAVKIGSAASAVLLPYLLFNFILYSDPLFPLREGNAVIAKAGLWMFQGEWYYYLVEILKDNALLAFTLPGMWFTIREKKPQVIIPVALFLLYFSFLAHKELRFALVFLPFLSILAAYGFFRIVRAKRRLLYLCLIVFVIFAVNIKLEQWANPKGEVFYKFLEGKTGQMLISNPSIGVYSDGILRLMYYPIFNSTQARYWENYIVSDTTIKYIALDTCSGLLCSPEDKACPSAMTSLNTVISGLYDEVFNAENEGCFYRIFKNLELKD